MKAANPKAYSQAARVVYMVPYSVGLCDIYVAPGSTS